MPAEQQTETKPLPLEEQFMKLVRQGEKLNAHLQALDAERIKTRKEIAQNAKAAADISQQMQKFYSAQERAYGGNGAGKRVRKNNENHKETNGVAS